jgi:hypothetical protein
LHGPTIDLTEGARRALGLSKKQRVRWRFVDEPVKSLDESARSIRRGERGAGATTNNLSTTAPITINGVNVNEGRELLEELKSARAHEARLGYV